MSLNIDFIFDLRIYPEYSNGNPLSLAIMLLEIMRK